MLYKDYDLEYSNLLETVNLLTTKLKKIIIKPEKQEKYDRIYDYVIKINKKLNLTKNLRWSNDIYDKVNRKPKDYLKTDEHLITILFYKSIEEGKNYALITNDWGIRKLAYKFHEFMYLDDSYKEAIEALYKNPVKIYVKNVYNDDYKIKFSSETKHKYSKLEKGKEQLAELKKESIEIFKI